MDKIIEKLDSISRRDVLKAGVAAGIGLAGVTLGGCISPSTGNTKSVVRIGYQPSDHHAPLFVAKTKGFFEKYGMTVELTKFDSGALIMQQIVGGTIDIGLVGVVPVIITADKDSTIKLVGAVHNTGSGLIVKKGSNIASVADLKGKKIGTPGPASIQNFLLKTVLANNNIDYTKDVTVSTVPAAQILGSLESGTIDAYMAWEPFMTMAVQKGVADILLTSDEIMPGHPCCGVTTTTGMIKDYPGSVLAFMKAHKEGTEFVNSNLDEAAAIVGSSEWLSSGTDTEKVALTHMKFLYKPDEGFISGTETFARMLKDAGSVTKELKRDELFDLSFVNQV